MPRRHIDTVEARHYPFLILVSWCLIGHLSFVKFSVPAAQEAWWAPGPVLTGLEYRTSFACLDGDGAPNTPACSRSLYRLRYSGPLKY
jgi:hypothetical protein